MSDVPDSAVEDSAQSSKSNPERSVRLVLVVAILFCIGALLGLVVKRSSSASSDIHLGSTSDRFDMSIPDPGYTPEDVVRMQMNSLRDGTRDSDMVMVCYSLASPANREQTGPFENFAVLVGMEPYAQLGRCKEFQIGNAIYENDHAAVLVTLLSPEDDAIAFRFILAKQTVSPYADCWMTESVFQISQLNAEVGHTSDQAVTID